MPAPKDHTASPWRYAVLSAVLALCFAALVAQLIALQLVRGTAMRSKADSQSLRRIWVPALRGTIYDRNLFPLAENRPAFDIDVNVDELSARQVTNTVRHLAYLLREPEEKLFAQLAPHKRFSYTPAKIARDVPFGAMVRVAERLTELEGVDISVNPVRDYPHGRLGCHVIGYVSKVPRNHPRLLAGEYSIHDRVGVTGIELVCEDMLHGQNGKRLVQVDHASRYVTTLNLQPPMPGHDVILTIDMTLQETLTRALSNRVGAAVAIDPNNGDVLALVSSPGFDPGFFTGTVDPEQYRALQSNRDRPFFNRAIAGQYPLGSVFKLVTATAGLEANVFDAHTSFQDPGVFELGRMRVRNFRGARYGTMALPYALRVSCNTFFCHFARAIGVANLSMYGRILGFGAPTGVQLPGEAPGIMPDPSWKRINRRLPWYPGDTVNLSIGHGYLLVTPMQVAGMVAAIANGGTWHPPRLIRSYVIGGDVAPVAVEQTSKPLAISWETLATVRSGMWQVVNTPNGSGRRAHLGSVEVAGKTGSAMLGPETYAWFAAFAPFDAPRLAIAVVVEHAQTGGLDAAPIAQQAFASYFDVELAGLTNRPIDMSSITD